MRGVELADVEIHGEITNLTINGVERRTADRGRARPPLSRCGPRCARPTRPASARHGTSSSSYGRRPSNGPAAWTPELLHESVDGEWSFIETLRHLVFATDAWIRRGHPRRPVAVGSARPAVGRDAGHARHPARPRRAAVARRRARAAPRPDGHRARGHRRADRRSLAADTEPVEGPGWPPPRSFPVREVPADHPQRGVGAPPLRRARPGRCCRAGESKPSSPLVASTEAVTAALLEAAPASVVIRREIGDAHQLDVAPPSARLRS